ncbi:hypothetical protein G3567_07210 [Psychroflexus sp. YR1-1]|uniref:phosphoribosylglycinamide formyltransferase 1 n=1 Tax=Psychroflexus aurantiacus TaxID=2709310 RepID=A0A6B3R050_9FLAO|nr:formyltransferase family protein [Psychroflexus aurantiacus]NEV93933.1 hypothetical protein [Psychroflexus aurantiacus]
MASKLAENLNITLIVAEEKSDKIEDTGGLNKEDRDLMESHFEARSNSEQKFFKDYTHFPEDVAVKPIEFGTLNSEFILQALEDYKIDFLVLFGSSIVKDKILEKFSDKVINMHLGLSPYYKGSGTNFFPAYHNEFSCIGATIHLASSKVDAGDILHQLRLDSVEEKDSLHDLGNRIIDSGGRLFPKVIENYIKGELQPQKQRNEKGSKTFKLKDFTVPVLRKTYQNYTSFFDDYRLNKTILDKNYPIVQQHEK